MLNTISLMGRLTRDPELRYTQSNTEVANFTLAVDRDFSGKDGCGKQTDFINCVAWSLTAKFVSKYFHKGNMVAVKGSLQIRNYEDKDGNKRQTAEVVVDNAYFAESKKDNIAAAVADSGFKPANGFVPVEMDDGDIPF